MKVSGLLFVVLLTVASLCNAQTSGCEQRDYKCQLANGMAALTADPRNPENYYNLGLIMQRTGAHKDAADIFSLYVAIPA